MSSDNEKKNGEIISKIQVILREFQDVWIEKEKTAAHQKIEQLYYIVTFIMTDVLQDLDIWAKMIAFAHINCLDDDIMNKSVILPLKTHQKYEYLSNRKMELLGIYKDLRKRFTDKWNNTPDSFNGMKIELSRIAMDSISKLGK